MKRELLSSTAFIRATKRFAKRDRATLATIESSLALLREDAFDARLRTHKLSGSLAGLWACSAGYDLRIVFEFVTHENAEAILLISCGTHDDVY